MADVMTERAKERRIGAYARLLTAEHALDQAARAIPGTDDWALHDITSALEIVRSVMHTLKRLEGISP